MLTTYLQQQKLDILKNAYLYVSTVITSQLIYRTETLAKLSTRRGTHFVTISQVAG